MSDTATIRIDCDQQSVCTNMDSVLASTTVAGPLETGRAAAIVTCLLPDIKALMEMSRGQLREAVEARRPTEPNSMDDAALAVLHKVGIYDLMQELADATDSAAWDIWLSILRHEGDPTWKLAPPRYVVYDEVKT